MRISRDVNRKSEVETKNEIREPKLQPRGPGQLLSPILH